MPAPRLPLALLALLLAGCASDRFRLAGMSPAGTTTTVRVLGRAPRVVVSNEGPGQMRLWIDAPGDAEDEEVTLAPGRSTTIAAGPVVVTFTPIDVVLDWTLVAQPAKGLEADLVVEGFEWPDDRPDGRAVRP